MSFAVRLRVRWVLTLLGLAAVTACTRSNRPVVAVDVVKRADFGHPSLDEPRLRVEVERHLAEVPGLEVRPAKDNEVPYQARLTVDVLGMAPDPSGGVRTTVGLGLSLWPLAQGEAIQVSAVADEVGPKPAHQGATDAALRALFRRLAQRLELETASPGKVAAAIRSDDPFLQRAGVQVAGQRQLIQAIEALSERVRDPETPEPGVLDAVGALVAIGDPKGAPALIDAARQKPPDYVIPLIHALARLGGRQAEGYLFTLKQGHPSPRIRAEAEQAWKQLTQGVP